MKGFWLGGIWGCSCGGEKKLHHPWGLLNRAAMLHADTFFRNFEMSLVVGEGESQEMHY